MYTICKNCKSYEVSVNAKAQMVAGQWIISSVGAKWKCDKCGDCDVEFVDIGPQSRLWYVLGSSTLEQQH